jgi:hypothetical protein
MSNLRLIVGSKGYAPGGSRAEPWPCFLPWFPGLETDMRSLRYHTREPASRAGWSTVRSSLLPNRFGKDE